METIRSVSAYISSVNFSIGSVVCDRFDSDCRVSIEVLLPISPYSNLAARLRQAIRDRVELEYCEIGFKEDRSKLHELEHEVCRLQSKLADEVREHSLIKKKLEAALALLLK